MRAILLVPLLFAGCVRDAYVSEPSEHYESVVSRTIHGDTRFSKSERALIQSAAAAWGIFTHGRAKLTFVWDLDDESLQDLADRPMIVRSNKAARVPDCGGNVDGDVMRIVPAVCPDTYACTLHEMGHYLGIGHVPYPHSVMSARGQVRQFSSADREACVGVGLCDRPRAKDITTVNVTIDPAIPPVEPEYPEWPITK